MENTDNYYLQAELESLQHEFGELESMVYEELDLDPLTIKRVSKRKAWVKERLEMIRSLLYPEVIA